MKIAQQRAAAEGLPCDFRIQDYRKVSEKFDRIVSVGMFEHVGSGITTSSFANAATC